MKKVLLSTKSFPPVIGGSAFLLYEILRHFPANYFCVFHGVNDPPGKESSLKLPFIRKQVKFINDKSTPRATRYLSRIYQALIEHNLQKEVARGNIRKVYAHFPNALFVVAAYKVAKRNNLPLVIYFDILWDAMTTGAEQELSKKYEAEIVAYAERVYAITEFACEYLGQKHHKKVELIPHTVDTSLLDFQSTDSVIEHPKIHFAGGIYEAMNTDSILRLVDAVEMHESKIELEFCSPDLPATLIHKGYKNLYVNKEKLIELQRSSSILFLPQAFHGGKHEMIKNNFPTKIMEYVCSGVPILLHSPKDSYLTYIAKKEGFAYVVDEDDPLLLRDAISKLLSDTELRASLITKAFEFARSRDSRFWSTKLKEALDSE